MIFFIHQKLRNWCARLQLSTRTVKKMPAAEMGASTRTESEVLFESFCDLHQISWEIVHVANHRTPDYRVLLNGEAVYFEVKQIDSDIDFNTQEGGVSSRTVGSHIRQRIQNSRTQVQMARNEKIPGVLVIYNNLDPFQNFGTEQHDFISAMYGEWTVPINGPYIKKSYQGRNSLLKHKNKSFSAVAHLRNSLTGPKLCVYENIFSSFPLKYNSLPNCIDFVRIDAASIST